MILEMKNIVKTYGSVTANNNISIHLNKGEILSIVGENGAGKSTIMKILYGLEKPDSGEIIVRDKKMSFKNPSDAMAQGIGMVQQHFMLFESMTVAENIVYKNEITKGLFLDKAKTKEKIQELSDTYKLKIDPDQIVEDCPVGLKQRIEILKILYQNAEIIIFDEPSAVLTPPEVEELLATMKRLAAMGKSLILITHKLHEVMAVSDRVVVMRSGEMVAETAAKDTDVEKLSYAMVGRQIKSREVLSDAAPEQILEVAGLTLHEDGRDVIQDINIHVSGGEIVGIAGVSGNGQSELIQCIAGLKKSDSGKVFLKGQDITGKSVQQIRDSGLAHIPEDRYVWGSALAATLEENALMGYERSAEYASKGILNAGKIRDHSKRLIQRFLVKAESEKQQMNEMSGGNAQKLIVAREMEMKTPLLIACEPTRGIDIGAMEFIHDKLVEKKQEGDGILLVSSELSEIISLCDRIYVMFEGRMNGELVSGEIDEKKLGLMMTGGAVHE